MLSPAPSGEEGADDLVDRTPTYRALALAARGACRAGDGVAARREDAVDRLLRADLAVVGGARAQPLALLRCELVTHSTERHALNLTHLCTNNLRRCLAHHLNSKELDELRENVGYWKNKRQSVINIIKAAYQNQLIGSKPTGVKYQATIKNVLPKVEDNFLNWSDDEKKAFGIKKTVSVETVRDGEVLKKQERLYADKEELRQQLMQDSGQTPEAARLVRRVSLSYGLRKRLQKGV